MKRIMLSSIFMLCLSTLQAQVLDTFPWCPSGATWVYFLTQSPFSGIEFITVKYEKDTVVANQLVKKLAVSEVEYYNLNPIQGRIETFIRYDYEYISNDSLFYYDASKDTFFLKYDFGTILGDSIMVNRYYTVCNSDTTFPDTAIFHVATTTQDTIGNFIFPTTVYDDFSNSGYYLLGRIRKNIGSDIGFHPTINATHCLSRSFPYSYLSCYYDDARGLVLSNSFQPCFNITSINEIEPSRQQYPKNEIPYLSVYPNPASTYVLVDYKFNDIPAYEIYNVSGKLVTEGILSSNEIKVNHLPQGIYFVRFRNEGNLLFYAKFIKN